MGNLEAFIDQFLSLPWDTRRDCISIAERNVTKPFKPIDVYDYIYWRYTLPMNHVLSWYYLFEKDVAVPEESL